MRANNNQTSFGMKYITSSDLPIKVARRLERVTPEICKTVGDDLACLQVLYDPTGKSVHMHSAVRTTRGGIIRGFAKDTLPWRDKGLVNIARRAYEDMAKKLGKEFCVPTKQEHVTDLFAFDVAESRVGFSPPQ